MTSLRAHRPFRRLRDRGALLLFVFPAVSALFTLGTMGWMAGYFDPSSRSAYPDPQVSAWDQAGDTLFSVVFNGYSLLPAAALAVLIWWAGRYFPSGLPVVAVGCLAFTAATVWLLVGIATDDSSTAALGLLVVPPALGVLLLPFAGVAVLVHARRDRRACG